MKGLEQLADEGELTGSADSGAEDLIKAQLYNVVREASIERRIGRQLVGVINQKAGKTFDMILADKDSMEFRKVAEMAQIPVDTEAYTKVSITPIKYGNTIMVSTELQEDANWDVVKRNLRQAGREAGVKEDVIIFSEFDDSSTGIASDSNQTFNSAGTELSIADIVGLMRRIEIQDYEPNALALHPTQIEELRQIDTFVEADKVGSRITFEQGFVGRIFGMDTVRSKNVWAESGVYQSTNQDVYCVDTNECAVLIVRRPLTLKTFDVPDRDALAVALTYRQEARTLRPKAGCQCVVQ